MSGSVELLRLLGSGVRPAGADQAHGGPPAPSLERADFAALLKQARSGGMPSHLPVTVESGANVQLSADELEGLSAMADQAEAAGVRNALVMFPDKTVVLDVHTRTVKAAPDMTSGVITGVDGVIKVPGPGEPGAPAILPTLPGGIVANPSVAKLLGSQGRTPSPRSAPAAKPAA